MSIAGRTYKALQDEVLQFQFEEQKYRPLVSVWLNDAQRKAVLESELRTQEQAQAYETTSGDATLALPEDYARWIDFYDTETNEHPVELTQGEYDAAEVLSGRPGAYVVIGEEITLYPVPDAAYGLSLRYWRLPQDMSADGDVPEIPPQYHNLLVAYAMQRAYARENDYTASRFWREEWEAGMLKMRGEASHDTAAGPEQVQGMWGGRGVNTVARGVWR